MSLAAAFARMYVFEARKESGMAHAPVTRMMAKLHSPRGLLQMEKAVTVHTHIQWYVFGIHCARIFSIQTLPSRSSNRVFEPFGVH